VLLRLGRRKASTELTDVAAFCDIEFQARDGPGLDLRLSVFEIEGPHQVVQAHAEHSARERLGRQAKRNLDLTETAPAAEARPLPNAFAFTARAHREIPFDNDEAVRAMATSLYRELAQRRYPVTKAELRAYTRARRDAGDREWLAFYATRAASDW
jgi:hypothetical protein